MPLPCPRPVLLLVAALATGCAGAKASRAPESLTVRELTIVDAQGTPRVRLGAPLPDPKGLKRKVKPVGLQFMDPEGKEVGGLVQIDSIGVHGLCFDSPEGYGAMCMGLEQGKPTITFRDDWKERILIGVDGGTARIVLHDAQGQPRLRLEVDEDGASRVEPLAPGGK
jgi:hypothetical protein